MDLSEEFFVFTFDDLPLDMLVKFKVINPLLIITSFKSDPLLEHYSPKLSALSSFAFKSPVRMKFSLVVL